jgi:hypothetical protein
MISFIGGVLEAGPDVLSLKVWKMGITHLHGGDFLQDGSGSWSRGMEPYAMRQIHVETVGHKGDEEMRLNAMLELAKNGAQRQILFEVLKGRFDFDRLHVELPQLGRITPAEVGAKHVATLAAAGLA